MSVAAVLVYTDAPITDTVVVSSVHPDAKV